MHSIFTNNKRLLSCASIAVGYKQLLERRRGSAYSPDEYAKALLPFSMPIFSYQAAKPASVPADVVIGYTEKAPNNRIETPSEVMDRLNGATTKYVEHSHIHPELARFAQIGNLPLLCAIDGEHRVGLYLRNGRPIRAVVSPTTYPAPAELTVVEGAIGGWWLACSNSEVCHATGRSELSLPFPEVSVPLLLAYGAKIERRWRISLPAVHRQITPWKGRRSHT